MVTPLTLTSPFKTTWHHGTDAQQFTFWQCPPPRPSPADVAHTGLFFTTNHEYAKGAGKNVCTIKLSEDAKLIVPAHGGTESTAFREAVIKSNPVAAHCQWLTDDAVWTTAWSTGEVMRFGYNANNPEAVLEIGKALSHVAASLKQIIKSPVSNQLLMNQAIMCLTRGWIEQLVCEAKKLGYQAIQGAEIDRWSATNPTPIAQPWLAVMDTSVITAPTWL